MTACSRALALAAAAWALSGCALFGGDDDAAEPPAELVDFRPSLKIDRAWSIGVGSDGESKRLGLAPSTDGTRVYAAGHGGRVVAVDAQTGELQWSVDTRLRLSAGPQVGDGYVIVGSSDGDVLAFAAATGEERWQINVASELLAPPAVGNGVVVLRTVDGRLLGFSVGDGGRLWSVEESVPRLSLRGNSPPIIAGVNVLAGFDNGKVGAYDLATGALVWEVAIAAPRGRTELERLVDISSALVVIGDDAYGVGYQGRAVAIAVETGLVLWQREISSYSGLGADWNNVYVSTAEGDVVALSRQGGRPLWDVETLARRDLTAPTAMGETIVVGDFEGYLHWLAKDDGRPLARVRLDNGRVASARLLVGNLLIAQSEAGRVSAFAIEP